jgi:hypothetical protein
VILYVYTFFLPNILIFGVSGLCGDMPMSFDVLMNMLYYAVLYPIVTIVHETD